MSHALPRRTLNVQLVPLALAAAGVLILGGCGKEGPAGPAAPEVFVADVLQKDVPVYMELVGQTKGFQDVDIRARVEGYLESVFFTEGTFVTKGTLLYQIDPKPFEASLAAAKANLATSRARLEKANNDVARYRPLVAEQAVSRQELDNAVSAQEAATSQVDAAQAAVEQATLDLGYTRITAPLDGLVGTTQVKSGNLVGRGESTLLTTVSQMDPILFRASITEADYLRIAKQWPDVEARRAARGSLAIQLLLADGTVYPHVGRVDSLERAVDPTTGTIAVQLKFPNPDRLLRPGQYGRARFVLDTRTGALLVPQRAVSELQNLYSVAVVGPDNKVAFRNVKVGPRVESLWVVEQGLKPGDRVVVEGLQKVRDGATVNPKPVPPAPAGSGAAEPAGKAE